MRRRLYWSVRRELWEHRWPYVALLVVAAVSLLGFAAGPARFGVLAVASLNFTAGALMATLPIVAVIYCLEALYGERRDRGILFWKSLPVSDLAVVLAKASVPLLVLPLFTFALTVVTQALMLLIAGAARLGGAVGANAPLTLLSVSRMWAALLCHLVTVHALYYAPIYGWLLLASAWARRAPLLWATLPVLAVLIVEKLAFNASVFLGLLASRLTGGPAAIPFPMGGALASPPTLLELRDFLASPGLWVGLAVCAAFLLAAARLRRRQGPI